MCEKKLADRISAWIREKVEEAGADGVVVGMSGGLDSSTTAVLAKMAMGDRMLGLIMPCHSDPEDRKFAELVAKKFGIETRYVDLTPVFDRFVETLPPGDRVAVGNLKPRLRMTTLYYFANRLNYLVVGTGNKSEILCGYFTKYGDGGVDILPLGGLLKTQVRQLANELGIPEEIIKRTPSAGLWEGQTDEGELGITYEELDEVLIAIEGGDIKGYEPQTLEKVKRMIRNSEHKREKIPVFEDEGAA
jgi:NAD+ synthase